MKANNSLFFKIAFVALIALLMLIPLSMVKNQIRERQGNADACQDEVSQSWGRAQTLAGPALVFTYEQSVKDADGKSVTKSCEQTVYPKTLLYEIGTQTQKLHRSIYDVMVYHADVVATGTFVLPASLASLNLKEECVKLGISDLRGIEGNALIRLGEQDFHFSEGASGDHDPYIREGIRLEPGLMDGVTEIPFRLQLRTRGSRSILIKPYGDLTEVRMSSDCPDPSFTGDFLPTERKVDGQGFTAKWVVSQINRGKPDDTTFGVRLLENMTQYRQTERSVKYGILIILLIFVCGLGVELMTAKEINLVQYGVIGLSLVLFYALVLSFSEFLSFPLAYALAATMTTLALLGYFRGILKSKEAWLLGGLVAVAYAVSYVLLQMETYAFLAGTLILFAVLAGIMYLTRNMNRPKGTVSE